MQRGHPATSQDMDALPTPSSIPTKRRSRLVGSNRSSRLVLNAPLSWLSDRSDHIAHARPTSQSSHSSDRVRVRLAGDHMSFTRSSNGSFDWRSSLHFVGLRSSKASDEIHHFLPSGPDSYYDSDHRASDVLVEQAYESGFQLPVTQFDPEAADLNYSEEEEVATALLDSISTPDAQSDTDNADKELASFTDDQHGKQQDAHVYHEFPRFSVSVPGEGQSILSEVGTKEAPDEDIDVLETEHRDLAANVEPDNELEGEPDVEPMADTHLDDQPSDQPIHPPIPRRYRPFKLPSNAHGYLFLSVALAKYSIHVNTHHWRLYIFCYETLVKKVHVIETSDQPLLMYKDFDAKRQFPVLALSYGTPGARSVTFRLQVHFNEDSCLVSLTDDESLSLDPETTKTPLPKDPDKLQGIPTVEIFKSFRVSYNDPCYRVLPAALRKYGIGGDWRKYALYIVYGDQERCIGLQEKPLAVFKELDQMGVKPMFMLRKFADKLAPSSLTPVNEVTEQSEDAPVDETPPHTDPTLDGDAGDFPGGFF